MDNVIGGKFKLGRKIGGGSFGELFLGKKKNCFSLIRCNLYSIFLITLFDLNLIYWKCFSGVSVQTGEEVAVKLV